MAKGKKTGGRKPNSLNRISSDLRSSITEFLENNFDVVVEEWNTLEGKDKLMFYKELLKYSVPALQTTTIIPETPTENKVIKFKFGD